MSPYNWHKWLWREKIRLKPQEAVARQTQQSPMSMMFQKAQVSFWMLETSYHLMKSILDSSYSWTPIEGTTLSTDARKENSTLSFTAPYVTGDGITKRLSFELTMKDKSGKTRRPYNANVVVKRVHRAIIFQGGVALGAYEAGAYQAIIEKLGDIEDKIRKDLKGEKRPLFDIVAGASIGAMNGAIVVSSVTKSGKSLEDEENWKEEST